MKWLSFSIHLTLVGLPAQTITTYAATERAALAAATMWALRRWPQTGVAAQVDESSGLVVGGKATRRDGTADLVIGDFTGEADVELAVLVESGSVRVEPHPGPGGPPFYAALEALPLHTP